MTTTTMLSSSYAPSTQSSYNPADRLSTLSTPQMSEYSAVSYGSWSPEPLLSPTAGPSSDYMNQRPQYTSVYSNTTSITRVMEHSRFSDPQALQPTNSANIPMPSPHGRRVSSFDPYTSSDQEASRSHSRRPLILTVSDLNGNSSI